MSLIELIIWIISKSKKHIPPEYNAKVTKRRKVPLETKDENITKKQHENEESVADDVYEDDLL